MRRQHLGTIFFAFLFQSAVFSQPFTLVKDINLGPGDGPVRPTNLTEAGGFLFFTIKSGAAAGLWKTDGTEAGSVRVKALSPGETIEFLVKADDVLFFIVNNTSSATTSLWKSDGTTAGSCYNPNLVKLADTLSNCCRWGPLFYGHHTVEKSF